ncbi:MAG: sigma-70 family RNA polymerase sigma factor [Actinomycetota bacterium]|nr:sigma-70 family RNA polymerase sigma factor [Actinomycetota bacterium]
MSQPMEDLIDGNPVPTSMAVETRGVRVTNNPRPRPRTPRREPSSQARSYSDFDRFYAENRDQIARALSLSLRNPDLGTEAADEAFVRACQRWSEVSTFANPQGWVYRVGMNWARSWLRRARREREKRPLIVKEETTEDQIMDVDLERALETLTPGHRTVVVARFFMGWSIEETARALELRPGTVKSRLSRALNQLAGELDESTSTGVPASEPEEDSSES